MNKKAFKYRLYPTLPQQRDLERTLALCRQLYNAALQERREAYQKAVEAADSRQMQISPENTEWVKFWQDYKKELGLPVFRIFNSLDEK